MLCPVWAYLLMNIFKIAGLYPALAYFTPSGLCIAALSASFLGWRESYRREIRDFALAVSDGFMDDTAF